MQKGYLAGPMTGLPSFNIPAFDAAAKDLRLRGWDVVSPAELDEPELRAAEIASVDGNLATLPGRPEWGDLLARDLVLITTAGLDAVWVLPGWENSPGARLETFVARVLKRITVLEYGTSRALSLTRLIEAWVGPAHEHYDGCSCGRMP